MKLEIDPFCTDGDSLKQAFARLEECAAAEECPECVDQKVKAMIERDAFIGPPIPFFIWLDMQRR